MIDHDKHVGEAARPAGRAGHRRRHHRDVLHGQRPAHELLAGRGMTPFRNEKNSNWEGAFRVPMAVRWPGQIAAGAVSNEIVSHHDWLPTFLHAAGEPEIVDKLKAGATRRPARPSRCTSTATTCCPTSPARTQKHPRQGFIYFSDDGDLTACASTTGRWSSWSSAPRGRCASGPSRSSPCGCPRSSTCAPTPTSGRTSPPTPTTTGCSTTPTWSSRRRRRGRVPGDLPGVPPRQKAASFTIDQVMEKMTTPPGAGSR